jgi:ABC-type Zn2+ transport system substrate-binding protein/surface adhesin
LLKKAKDSLKEISEMKKFFLLLTSALLTLGVSSCKSRDDHDHSMPQDHEHDSGMPQDHEHRDPMHPGRDHSHGDGESGECSQVGVKQ